MAYILVPESGDKVIPNQLLKLGRRGG
jgi:hypothetical protein